MKDIKKVKDTLNNLKNFTLEQCEETENILASIIKPAIEKADITSANCGIGQVVEVRGQTLETLVISVQFAEELKKLSVKHLALNSNNIYSFKDPEIPVNFKYLYSLHIKIEAKYQELRLEAYHQARADEKTALAEKKAEEKYQNQKAKAIKDFKGLSSRAREEIAEADKFYYALGWITKRVGTISAALPDYLVPSFEKTFGVDAKPKVANSRKRTSGGFPTQWALSMTATLRGTDRDTIPNILTPYLSTSGKALANTNFVWDLVERYGFQFGKKQDKDKILNSIPNQYISSFESGYSA